MSFSIMTSADAQNWTEVKASNYMVMLMCHLVFLQERLPVVLPEELVCLPATQG